MRKVNSVLLYFTGKHTHKFDTLKKKGIRINFIRLHTTNGFVFASLYHFTTVASQIVSFFSKHIFMKHIRLRWNTFQNLARPFRRELVAIRSFIYLRRTLEAFDSRQTR